MYKRQDAKTTFPWCPCPGLAVGGEPSSAEERLATVLAWLTEAETKARAEFKAGDLDTNSPALSLRDQELPPSNSLFY